MCHAVGLGARADLAEWTPDLEAQCLSMDLRLGKQTIARPILRLWLTKNVQYIPVCSYR